MMLRVRRVGNSLGVIIPKATLEGWGVGDGDSLELSGRVIRPRGGRLDQDALDGLKRRIALAVVARCTAREIRAHGLANLHRWKASGAWVSAYDEWQKLLEEGSDGELFATMLGQDERANRLRQSPPYVGMLPRDEIRRLNEETPA